MPGSPRSLPFHVHGVYKYTEPIRGVFSRLHCLDSQTSPPATPPAPCGGLIGFRKSSAITGTADYAAYTSTPPYSQYAGAPYSTDPSSWRPTIKQQRSDSNGSNSNCDIFVLPGASSNKDSSSANINHYNVAVPTRGVSPMMLDSSHSVPDIKDCFHPRAVGLLDHRKVTRATQQHYLKYYELCYCRASGSDRIFPKLQERCRYDDGYGHLDAVLSEV
ncbi:hypothetical protein PoB_000130600 [Plakobranchus ocellatus]|uniref:Uncharacterized protein n=1 Tax=Plakobranchus ocellatus TaxID=259542 RepID=A0AAV3XXJ9_9GAST|nr:hypothetical protein PoB_000130600 [Plakobranchus ocellatus]